MITMHSYDKKGFTLVELMLAMVFVSVLLLAIALTAIQSGRLYNRGTILRSINQAGRDISDNLRRDFLQANSQKINLGADSADMLGSVIEHKSASGKTGGRICLGYYSYVWNNAVDNAASRPDLVKYDSGEAINFVRVADSGGNLCRKTESSASKYPYVIKKSDSTELLKGLGEEIGRAHV